VELCLKKSTGDGAGEGGVELKQLPKIAYGLLSEKQIRKVLMDLGISTRGKKAVIGLLFSLPVDEI